MVELKVVPVHTTKAYGAKQRRFCAVAEPRQYAAEGSNSSSDISSPGRDPEITIRYVVEWAPGPIWTLEEGVKSLDPVENGTTIPGLSSPYSNHNTENSIRIPVSLFRYK